MSDTRLIEQWLPISSIGIESLRERVPMTPFPAPNRLHVWWARRPLIASRAAILASVLPASADQQRFLHVLGIHGDAVAARRKIDLARKTGENLGPNAYGYDRAFKYLPTELDREWINGQMATLGLAKIKLLDPTAGGGSIPFESTRLGFETFCNDLNPVASLIEKATIEFPQQLGMEVLREYRGLAARFLAAINNCFSGIFCPESDDSKVFGYLWSRTIVCPYCSGVVPLSPNWRLASDGTGVRLLPQLTAGHRVCKFEIVKSVKNQSSGTISDGDATCPFPDCGRVIDGESVKRQAQAGQMGDQLYGVVIKRREGVVTKSGKIREKWVTDFREATPSDDTSLLVRERLEEKLPEWLALDILPSEAIGDISNYDRGHRMYGMQKWTELFSSRQILVHGTAVEVFRALLAEESTNGSKTVLKSAAFVYLALVLDKMLNYNARSTRWDGTTGRIRSVFDSHNFAMVWSYAEMPPAIVGSGCEWAVKEIDSCLDELVRLSRLDANTSVEAQTSFDLDRFTPSPTTLTCKSGDCLDHIDDASIDCVVMDPPYYDNVMYAELSDFFYVWLKRTAGYVFPELFRRQLTDKENEAIANPAKFREQKGAKALAGRDYQDRMASIFTECRRVLRMNGIMTLMFTHKATGAWDALTKGLMGAGFTITASWPINTEAEGSLHIKNKAAANSTVFLVCRPRDNSKNRESGLYWEDVEPLVANAVRRNVLRFKEAGIGGVDLYLASFGPALEEFSKHWPLKRGTPRPKPEALKRKRQAEIFEEEFDPYAVTPEDALDAARREVKNWKLEQLTHKKGNADLDPATSWFVLAWDAFRAAIFDYDEALRLARAVGVDLDKEIIGRLAEKKGSDVRLWDSSVRAAKGSLGPADGSRAMIDAIHHAANVGRSRNLDAAREFLAKNLVDQDAKFFTALEAVLEVLPVSKAFTGIELEGDVAAQGSDFEVLENLRRLAFSDKVDEPKQLDLWKE
jgi:putative DNA methylase